jgi:uncharacterized protein YndB with AHSA1/START domain
MIEVIRERKLNVSVNLVWDLIEPVERLPEWLAACETAELLQGAGLGRRQRIGGTFGSKQFEIDQTVIEYQPNQVLAWRHDAERLDGTPAPKISRETEFWIHLQALDQGTQVRLVSRQVPGNLVMRLFLRTIAAPRIAGMMEESLGKMAQVLEGQPLRDEGPALS